jgi:hypothetical protein
VYSKARKPDVNRFTVGAGFLPEAADPTYPT